MNTEDNVDKLFDDAFAAAATDAETHAQTLVKAHTAETTKTPEEIAAEEAAKVAADAKTEEDVKAQEEEAAKVAAKKAEEDALAAMTPEEKTAKEATDTEAARVKKEGEEAEGRLKAKADADAAAEKKANEALAAAEAAKETPEQKETREKFEASLKPYEPTAEEVKALEVFEKEFPESAAAVKAKLKSVDRDINARVYQAVQAVLGHVHDRLAPVEKSSSEMTTAQHFAALHKAHEDYDAVIEKVPEWIKTQPALLQSAFQAAYDSGDTQSVLDLVASYKASAGIFKKGETPEQAAAKQKAADAAAVKAKKAQDEADALAPVDSKRTNTSPKGKKDPNDETGAFEEAAEAAEAAEAVAVAGRRR